jgi:hypothetical protein
MFCSMPQARAKNNLLLSLADVAVINEVSLGEKELLVGTVPHSIHPQIASERHGHEK